MQTRSSSVCLPIYNEGGYTHDADHNAPPSEGRKAVPGDELEEMPDNEECGDKRYGEADGDQCEIVGAESAPVLKRS